MKKLKHAILLSTALSAFVFTAQSAPVLISETHTNITCYGANNGTIDITPSGGTAPYTYNWGGGVTFQDRTNLSAGSYSVVVTDNLGATASKSITITEPSAIGVTKAITNVACGGDSTGAIDLTISGGTPGYSIFWEDSVTTEDRFNVVAKNRYFTVTDANGCIRLDSANVIQPPGMNVIPVIVNEICNNGNGSIDVSIVFGSPNFGYLWNDGTNTQDRSGLTAGTYTLTVTDVFNCTVSASMTVNMVMSPMSINTSSVAATCFGGSNGSITVTSVIGSTGPYSFAWNDGPLTQNRTGLSFGTYTVTATSSTGCSASTSVNITQPTQIALSFVPIPASCNGGSNGAIITTVSGGTSPYSYLWNDGTFTKNRTSLSSGSYTLTVTDFRGCTMSGTAVIGQPALALTATAIPSPVSCTGGASGSVITSVAGGTAPYSYWWNGGFTTPDRLNVSAGTYFVTATDNNGCTANANATIAPYIPLSASATSINNICFNGTSGSVNLTPSNGTAPYSYSWSNSSTTQDINGLSASIYTVTVTDFSTCTVTVSRTITQPPFPVTINTAVADLTCFGSNNGSINITASNGTLPYSYNWGSGIITQNRSSLTAGNYNVVVTDNNGCTASASATVAEPTPLVIVPTVTNAGCFGGNSGAINLSITGSFAPYAYLWNDGDDNQNRINLTAGIYTVNVLDNHGCQATASATVSQLPALNITPSSINPVCYNTATGSINLSVTGGQGPYSFDWGGSITAQNRVNLSAGTYSVNVNDNAGCSNNSTITLTQPTQLTATSSVSNVACNGGNTGTISLSPSGGNSPYSFNWGGGITTQNRTNLIAGSYTVTISDQAACTATHTATIVQSSTLNIAAAATNILCNGAGNGFINTTVTGGSTPYGFVWNDGVILQNRTSLTPGNYRVTVTDANVCTATATATLSEPAVLVTSTSVINPTCNNFSNGSINLTVSGGTGAYLYAWSNSSTSQDLSNIGAGNYLVNITDANNCVASTSATLNQPAALVMSTTQQNVGCSGGNSGSIDLTVTGGTAPHIYTWSNGASSQDISSLASGNYAVTVRDNNLCSAATSVVITQTTTLAVSETHQNVACFGGADGTLMLTVTGGTSPYSYNWGGNILSPGRTNLSVGNYTATITDNAGCITNKTVSIFEPAQLSLIINKTDVFCNSGTTGSIDLNVSGGTTNYNYQWSNNATTQDLITIGAGSYAVTVKDANNCSALTSAVILQPSAVQISFSTTDITCYGLSNGTITSSVSGGNGGYRYLWSNNQTSSTISSLTAANYVVTVNDALNCSAVSSASIIEPAQISITETHLNITCNGGNNGTISTLITGGTGGYNYLWSNNVTTQNLVNLTANNYTLSVTDGRSCLMTKTITITQPAALTLSESHTAFACSNNTGSIDLTVSGGIAPYNYLWNNNATTQDLNNLSAGVYSVVASDFNRCSATINANISSLPALNTTLIKSDLNCFGSNDGSVNLSVTGGIGPYTYEWSNGATSEDIGNLTANTYSVKVADAGNCNITSAITVTQPAIIQVNPAVNPVECFGGNNGKIDISVCGGTAPYNFRWSNTSITEDISSLSAGSYNVTVTDSKTCTKNSSDIPVPEPPALNITEEVIPVSCFNRHDGQIVLTVTGGTGPYSFTWNNSANTPTINQLASGVYRVTVMDQNNCVATDVMNLTAAAPLNLSSSVQNTSCTAVQNGLIDLLVSGGSPGYNYTWSNGEHTESLQHLSLGHYAVTITDARNCSMQTAFNISSDYELEVDATPSTIINAGESITLSAVANTEHGNIYSWTADQYTVCENCRTTDVSPASTTHYTVTVIDSNGCKAVDALTVDVNSTFNLFVPNAFTPNNDGNNDVLELYGDKSSITFLNFSIFDRWGEKVFESSDHQFTWDGMYKGQVAQPGVYIYVMKVVFSNGYSRSDYKGSVTIIR